MSYIKLENNIIQRFLSGMKNVEIELTRATKSLSIPQVRCKHKWWIWLFIANDEFDCLSFALKLLRTIIINMWIACTLLPIPMQILNVIMRNRGEGETVSPIQIKTHAYKYNNKNNHHKANTECDYEK